MAFYTVRTVSKSRKTAVAHGRWLLINGSLVDFTLLLYNIQALRSKYYFHSLNKRVHYFFIPFISYYHRRTPGMDLIILLLISRTYTRINYISYTITYYCIIILYRRRRVVIEDSLPGKYYNMHIYLFIYFFYVCHYRYLSRYNI